MGINEEHSHEKLLVIQRFPWQGDQPLLLAFGRNSKAGRGMGERYLVGRKRKAGGGKFQVCPDWNL